jgi:uncharacterized protein YodC (DUF2158 family)
MKNSFSTGDLVYLKLSGEIIPSTLGVVTSSMEPQGSYRILWLDDASEGSHAWYGSASLQAVPDASYDPDCQL